MHKNYIPTCDCPKLSNKNHPCQHLGAAFYFVNLDDSDIYYVNIKIAFWVFKKPDTNMVAETSSFVPNLCPIIISKFTTTSGFQQ